MTCLHLSASKFSDAPSSSSGAITNFLSSDAPSTQSLLASTQTPTVPKTQTPPKVPGVIESLFHKAAIKKKSQMEEACKDEPTFLSPTPVENIFTATPQTNTGASSAGISSFFQKKSLQKSLQLTHSLSDASTSILTNSGQGETAEHSSVSGTSDSGPSDYPPCTADATVSSEDFHTCERCGQKVVVWDVPEHTDYHFALDLQKSLSSSSPSTSGDSHVRAGTPQTSRGKSRTKIQGGPVAKRARAQRGTGTLDSFFRKM